MVLHSYGLHTTSSTHCGSLLLKRCPSAHLHCHACTDVSMKHCGNGRSWDKHVTFLQHLEFCTPLTKAARERLYQLQPTLDRPSGSRAQLSPGRTSVIGDWNKQYLL